MKVNSASLLETLESSLLSYTPLPEALELLPGLSGGEERLGRFHHGQLLDWRDAWDAMNHPGYAAVWQIVPLRGGRLALARAEGLPEHHLGAAALWQSNAVGVLVVLAGAGGQDGRA